MILIVDDDSAIRSSLSFMLKRAKYEVKAVSGPKEAIEAVRSTTPQLILMDMNFSLSTNGQEGLTLLKQVKLFCPQTPVILMTAWGRGQETDEPLTDNDGFDRSHIIGRSKALMDVLATVKRVARTNASILVTGESGTGKELIAEAVHRNSPRRGKPFVKVNLGGVSQTLFESEMFGHKKGAFTDAVSDRKGRFELADKGTIFLDEIGELDLSCQVKLLRVLQEQTFEPLGDSQPRKVDVRVVCATNADLEQMVREHTFREDLFYRINLITVHLPALRERREDIPLLARHFIEKRCQTDGFAPVRLTDDALDYLSSLPYPGNIRELKNFVERTLLVCGKEVLTADDFKQQYHPTSAPQTVSLQGMTLEEMERQTILQALEKHGNNLSQVAQALGISRAALYRRLEKYGISTND